MWRRGIRFRLRNERIGEGIYWEKEENRICRCGGKVKTCVERM